MNTPSPSNEKVDSTNFIFKSAGGTDISANITDEATIANNPPKDDPLQPPLDSISPSGASAGADTSSPESPTKKKLTLPETPRWRFVNKAKKTEGYSSSAAGTFVKGLSGEELAGKFIAPVWMSREKSEEEIVNAGSSEWEREEEERGKEEMNVCKLGRLNSDGDEVMETFEFSGVMVKGKNEHQAVEEAPSPEVSTADEQWDRLEIEVSEEESVEGEDLIDPEPTPAAFPPSPSYESIHESPAPADDDVETVNLKAAGSSSLLVASYPDEDVQQRPKKKRGALSLLLLMIVVIAVTLGVVLGRKKSDDENASMMVLETEETNVPSQSSTTYCPVNTKLFSIQHTSIKEENNWTNSYPKTWALKDACSDMEIITCLPCADAGNTSPASTSSPSSQIFINDNSTFDATSTSRYSPPTMSESMLPVAGLEKYMASSDGVSGCIPDGYEYVFEVKPSDNPEECCGFLSNSFRMNYNEFAVISDSMFNEFEDSVEWWLSERSEPCPTSGAPDMPSATPSETRTPYPTTQPTGNPTASPTTPPSSSPTLNPSDTPTPTPSDMPPNGLRLTVMPSFQIQSPNEASPTIPIYSSPTHNPSDSSTLRPSGMPSKRQLIISPTQNTTGNLLNVSGGGTASATMEAPIHIPSESPSEQPRYDPSEDPSERESPDPSGNPSAEQPIGKPSENVFKFTFTPSFQIRRDLRVDVEEVNDHEVKEHDRSQVPPKQ